MKFVFVFDKHRFESDGFQEVAEYATNWVDENWEVFVEWSNYLVTKDNYEEYIENFVIENVLELE